MSGSDWTTGPLRVGIVLPVHDEEHSVGSALDAVILALDHAGQDDAGHSPLDCLVVVVLDRCTDGSAGVVDEWRRTGPRRWCERIEVLTSNAGSVGRARRTGCSAVSRHWPTADPASIWLATTDADSRVPHDWITAQLRMRRAGVELWAGQVVVDDWGVRRVGTEKEWIASYSQEEGPVHGANLGVDAATYHRLGGFPTVRTGEDRGLVARALTAGARIHHDSTVKVVTSARRDARAPAGFAHALSVFEERVTPLGTPPAPVAVA